MMMTASTAVKMMERPFFVTDLITFHRVSSLLITSRSYKTVPNSVLYSTHNKCLHSSKQIKCSSKHFSKHSLFRSVVVTHQYAVEELVHTKTKDTHHQVDDVVHEPKVGQHLPWLLGERALVPHHTYQIYTFIYHLHKKTIPVL